MAASAESIEDLYRSRYASFRGGMTAITGSYDAARDVVQEAFALALRDREQYRGDGSLAAWVWRIAFRVATRSRSFPPNPVQTTRPPSRPLGFSPMALRLTRSGQRVTSLAVTVNAPTDETTMQVQVLRGSTAAQTTN